MKEKTIKILLMAVLLSGGVQLHSKVFTPMKTLPTRLTITMPKVSVDLFDLDLRDKLNRRIQNFSARKRMETLFYQGLNTLLLYNLTPNRRALLLEMSTRWKTGFGFLKKKAQRQLDLMIAFLQNRRNFSDGKEHRSSKIARDPNSYVGSIFLSRQSFQYLISSILSSIIILR